MFVKFDSSSKLIFSKFEQPEKAESPIDTTDVGIVTEVNSTNSEKQLFPTDVTSLSIITDVMLSLYKDHGAGSFG